MKHRVLMVSPYFYPEGGGLERYALWMAKKLSKKHNVSVLCITRGDEREDFIGEIRIRRIKPLFILSNTPVSFRFVIEVAREVKHSDFVVAHTPVPFAADIAVFFAKLKGLPVELIYHTVGLKKNSKTLDTLAELYSMTLERFTLRGVNITSVSKVVWEYLRQRGYNSKIVPPPIILPKKYLLRNFLKTRRNIILFVGQLGKYHRFKNLDILLAAFSKLHKRFPDWELWVVGEGNMKKEYINLSAELGIEDKIRFLGRIDDPQSLQGIYSVASILVLPSSFESFGMVVLEALASGVPVVVSPNVGAKVRIHKKNGVILRELSAAELEKEIAGLIENPRLLRKMAWIARRSVTLPSDESIHF